MFSTGFTRVSVYARTQRHEQLRISKLIIKGMRSGVGGEGVEGGEAGRREGRLSRKVRGIYINESLNANPLFTIASYK